MHWELYPEAVNHLKEQIHLIFYHLVNLLETTFRKKTTRDDLQLLRKMHTQYFKIPEAGQTLRGTRASAHSLQ